MGDELVKFAATIFTASEWLVGKLLERFGEVAAFGALIFIYGHFLSLLIRLKWIYANPRPHLLLIIIKDLALSR